MIAYKYIDYVLYFDQDDLNILQSGREISFDRLQNYTDREPMTVSLKDNNEIYALSKKHKGMLVFSNETLFAVIHLTETSPTKHFFYFNREWFTEIIDRMLSDTCTSHTIRWNGSGDKITLLAGNGREAQHFKMLYGPA